MSLNYDLTAVKTRLGDRYEEITTSPETRHLPEDQQKWHPVTDTLIWMSMAVDLRNITEANVDEWCFRVGLINRITGSANLVGQLGAYFLTRKDIENHIGMFTNVTTHSRVEWLKRIFRDGARAVKKVSLKDDEAAADIINRDVAKYMAEEQAKNDAAALAAEVSES